jgi:Tfp pilus assembly protein PilE
MTPLVRNILIGVTVMVLLVALTVAILAAVALRGWNSVQRAGNEAATLQNLKTIAAVETQYSNTHKGSYGTFAQLINEHLLSNKFATNATTNADGYLLTLSLKENPAFYSVSAEPKDHSTGHSHFYIDSKSEGVHVNRNGPAGPSDSLN